MKLDMKTLLRILSSMLLAFVITGCSNDKNTATSQLSEVQTDGNKITLKEWGLSFELPSSEWNNTPFRHESKPGAEVISYWRNGVVDSNGREIVPVLGIVVVDVPENSDIVEYSAIWRMNFPTNQIDDVFTKDDELINLSYAIGYKMRYIDGYAIEHTIFLLHAINETSGFQISLDSTSKVFEQFESEFLKILKSIKFVEVDD